jgi:hypothetical protein
MGGGVNGLRTDTTPLGACGARRRGCPNARGNAPAQPIRPAQNAGALLLFVRNSHAFRLLRTVRFVLHVPVE